MKEIKLHHIHVGKVKVSPSLPFGNGNILKASGLFTPAKDKVWLPVSAVLIEHPDALILVDTGWGRNICPDGKVDKKAFCKIFGELLWHINVGWVEPGMSISEQLAKLGISPTGLDYVVLSHLDCDHVSGLTEVADAKRILVSADELRFADSFIQSHTRYTPGLWDTTKIKTFNYNRTGLGPVGESLDLLGDGTIQLVHIPGHCKGLSATLVSNNERRALYFSDGGYATRSWKDMVLPGICEDTKAAYKSLEWIRDVSSAPDCIDTFACHDPEIAPHITTL